MSGEMPEDRPPNFLNEFLEEMDHEQQLADHVAVVEHSSAQDREPLPRPQPALPAFQNEVRSSDQVGVPPPKFPIIIAIAEHGEQQPVMPIPITAASSATAGMLESSTFVRFVPNMSTMFPSFAVNVRQNHLHGQQQNQLRADRKAMKARGQVPPTKTRWGFPAETHSEDHMEVDFELVLDQIVSLPISAQPHPTLPDKQVMAFSFTIKNGQRPIRIPRQSVAASFSADSHQATLSDRIMNAKYVTLYIRTDLSRDSINKWQLWLDYCLASRSLSADPGEHDDWWLRRMANYIGNKLFPFDICVPKHKYEEFPTMHHLVDRDERGRVIFNPVYNVADGRTVAKSHFPTMAFYIRHFTAALLWERDEGVRQKQAVYNDRIQLPARFTKLRPNEWAIDVQIKNPQLRSISKVVPRQGVRVRIYVDGLGDRSDVKAHSAFTGEVAASSPEEFDFSVVSTFPPNLREMQDSFLEGRYDVTVVYDDEDPTARRRLQAMQMAAKRHPDLRDVGGPDKFQLRNVIQDSEDAGSSPNFIDRYVAAGGDPTVLSLIQELRTAEADQEQRECMDSALEGVPSNVLLVQGYPGTGKTWTLAKLIVILMLLGEHVLIVSQSNRGVHALLDAIIAIIEGDSRLYFLQDRVVHLVSEQQEENLARDFAAGVVDMDGQLQYTNYAMSRRIDDYCTQHPEDPLVRSYLHHISCRDNGHGVSQWCDPSWERVSGHMRQRILDKTLCLCATTFVSAPIDSDQYPATVAVLDEAGVATEADLLMAIINHLGCLALLLLAGDPRQLAPVVESQSASHNALACVLAVSPLQRLSKAWHALKMVTLRTNYRGHPDTIAMPNDVFYDNLMVPGGDPNRFDTALSRGISSMFDMLMPHQPNPCTSEKRQLFVNVDSLSQLETQGTSKYNVGGINAVVKIVRHLKDTARASLGDIGVITMYGEDRRQMIRALREAGLSKTTDEDGAIEVSTVDSFQGKQKKVLLLHFVIARQLPRGAAHPFAFVSQPSRLCVATTRAEEMMIMVGNLKAWETWMNSVRKHPATGEQSVPRDAQAMVKIMQWVRKRAQVVNAREMRL